MSQRYCKVEENDDIQLIMGSGKMTHDLEYVNDKGNEKDETTLENFAPNDKQRNGVTG